MTDDGLTYEKLHAAHRRGNAAIAACAGIPTEALEAGVVEKMVSVVERLLASTEADTDEVARAEEAARALLQQIKGVEHD